MVLALTPAVGLKPVQANAPDINEIIRKAGVAALGNLALNLFGIDADERRTRRVRWCLAGTATVTIAGAISGYVANERSNSALLSAITGGESFAYIEPQDPRRRVRSTRTLADLNGPSTPAASTTRSL